MYWEQLTSVPFADIPSLAAPLAYTTANRVINTPIIIIMIVNAEESSVSWFLATFKFVPSSKARFYASSSSSIRDLRRTETSNSVLGLKEVISLFLSVIALGQWATGRVFLFGFTMFLWYWPRHLMKHRCNFIVLTPNVFLQNFMMLLPLKKGRNRGEEPQKMARSVESLESWPMTIGWHLVSRDQY